MATTKTLDLSIVLGITDRATPKLRLFESSVIRTVGAISAAFASIQTVVFPVTEAAKFEREMKNVQKTTGFTAAQIDTMSDSLVRMSTELGVSAIELAKIAAIAGQLGLGDQGREAVESFTESVARASVTLGVSAEMAATLGAQLQSIFGLGIGQVENTFSLLNELSNTSVAQATDLADIMKRIGTVAGTTNVEAAALAATLKQLGLPNEQAGTAGVKFLGNLLAESKKFAAAIGTTQQEWIQTVNKSSVDALKEVLTVLSKMERAESAALAKTLFGAGRLFAASDKLIGDAATGFQTLDRFLKIGNESFQEGTSSIKEYASVMDSVVEQTNILVASLKANALGAGNNVLSSLQLSIEELSESLQSPEVGQFFDDIGRRMAAVVLAVRGAVKWIAALDVEWLNVINTIGIFLGFKLLQFFAKIAAKVAFLGVGLLRLGSFINEVFALSTFKAWYEVLSKGLSAIAVKAALVGRLIFTIGSASTSAATRATGLELALVGVRNVLLSLLRFVGGPVTIIGTLIYTFWDDIKKLFGYVDAKAEQSRREAEAEARAAKKALADAKASAIESLAQVEKLREDPNFDFTVDIHMNTQELTTGIRESIAGFATLSRAIKNIQATLRLLGDKSAETARNIAREVDANARRRQQLQALQVTLAEQTSATPLSPGGVIKGLYDANQTQNDIDALNTEIQASNDLIAEMQGTADDTKESIDKFRKSLEDTEGTLNGVATTNVLPFMDQLLATYAQAAARQKEYTLAFQEADSARQKLLNADKSLVGGTKEAADALLKATERTEDLRVGMEQAAKATEGLRNFMIPLQQTAAGVIDNMSVDQINEYVDGLGNIDKLPTNVLPDQLRLQGFEILKNTLKLEGQRRGYKLLGGAAEAFETKATSAFDNIQTEVLALNDRMSRFALDFKRKYSELKIQVALEVETDRLDQGYDESIDRINRAYNKSISRTSSERKKAWLEERRDYELQEAKRGLARKKTDAEAKAGQAQINLLLQQQKKLGEDVQQAAKNNDLQKIFSLKNDAKDNIKEAQELLTQLQGLRTTDAFGNIKLKFTEQDLEPLRKKVAESGQVLGGQIGVASKTLKDSAVQAAELLSSTLLQYDEKIQKSERAFQQLLGSFTNAKEIADSMRAAIESASAGLLGATAEMQKVFLNPNSAVTGIDLGKLKEEEKARSDSIDRIIDDQFVKYTKMFKDVYADRNAHEQVLLDTQISNAKKLREFNAEFDRLGVEVPSSLIVKEKDVTDQTKDWKTIQIPAELVVKDVVNKSGATVSTGGGEQFASGGAVRGPGTGTSDSIAAWLSNGEFVVNAATTRLFGSKFFYGLQEMARRGRSPTQFKGGMPAFAGGGAVGSNANDFIGNDMVTLNLNIGGNSYQTLSPRDQVRRLARDLKVAKKGF